MNYKRKAHRGRSKQNTMDNNANRVSGNSESKWGYGGCGSPLKAHKSATQRNRVSPDEVE
jgi:hypothetical protein